MICITLVRKIENVHCRLFLSCEILIKKITIFTNIMKWYSDLALDKEYLIGIRGYRLMLHSIFSKTFRLFGPKCLRRNEQNLGVRTE